MGKIGQLKTDKSIEHAMREIKDWLNLLGVNGLTINTNYDARANIALLRFRYKDKEYEFRSTKQANCRLNMHGIARVMEYKVRAYLMGIEDFEKSMRSYLAIENKMDNSSNINPIIEEDEKYFVILGISKLASNDEIKNRYKLLTKSFHPDMALSIEAKAEFEKKFSEINMAYTEIKKIRGIN